jgi:hypothetical protein
MNELDCYFALAHEDIDLCDPLAWWYLCQKEYPHLYQLAQDILALPGQYTFSVMKLMTSLYRSIPSQ